MLPGFAVGRVLHKDKVPSPRLGHGEDQEGSSHTLYPSWIYPAAVTEVRWVLAVWHSGTDSGHGGSRLVPVLKERCRLGLQPEPELESSYQTIAWLWEQAGELVACEPAAQCSVNLSS